jgi:ankyrin repeat protein
LDPDTRFETGETLLHVASGQGHVESIVALLEYKASIDSRSEPAGWTALMTAVFNGRIAAAGYLIQQGADSTITAPDGISYAFLRELNGSSELPKVVDAPQAERKPDDSSFAEMLLPAVEVGDLELVKFLIGEGASPNLKGANRWSALMIAALAGHADIVAYLLSKGAATDAKDKNGTTALHAALIGGKPGSGDTRRIVKLLIDRGANTDSRTTDGLTARAIGQNLKYDPQTLALLPHPPLQRIEPDFKLRASMSRDDWRQVQRVLQKQGIYRGSIDGLPGQGTKGAVYAYYEPFFRDLEAQAKKAKQIAESVGTNFDKERLHAFGVMNRYRGEVRYGLADGYGYERYSGADQYCLYQTNRRIACITYYDNGEWEKKHPQSSKDGFFIIDRERSGRTFYGKGYADAKYESWGSVE